jgi:hypothetical protein
LRERLLRGRAGRIEALLWQYACGKPGSEEASVPDNTLAATWEKILQRQRGGQNRTVILMAPTATG